MLQRKKFHDPDETEVISSLIKDDNISGGDILNEIARARWESIGLIRMQIDWLKKRKALSAKKEKAANKKTDNVVGINTERKAEEVISSPALQNVPEKLPEVRTDLDQEVKEPFSLRDWNLFITENSWSSDPNHLINIPTNSRQDALDMVTKLTQRKVSIKPNSILSALEFYLRKDVMQKALATKIKYELDKWIKLKRAGYRILLLVPDPDEKQAIFFVEARGTVYKSL